MAESAQAVDVALRPAPARLIPPLELWEPLVAFAQTTPGKISLLGAFLALRFVSGMSTGVVLVLAATTFVPRYRRQLLAAASFGLLLQNGRWEAVVAYGRANGAAFLSGRGVLAAATLGSLALSAQIFWVARAVPRTRWRRPLLAILAGYFAMLAVATSGPMPPLLRTILWGLLVVFGSTIWSLAYTLLDRGSHDGTRAAARFVRYLPFWRTDTPVPKGGHYLDKIESRDARSLAVTQIKGIKLSIWAGVLLLGSSLLAAALHEHPAGAALRWVPTLALPTLGEAIARHAAGQDVALPLRWVVLFGDFVEGLFSVAVRGHALVAIVRMAGFRALRSTWRPLEAATIAEFWNRYYYYFKELLLEFFFYPTYLSCFKRHARLRLFFATVMAAGLGNFVYHFLRDSDVIVRLGLWKALASFDAYAVYVVVLALAIAVSQMRSKARAARGAAQGISPLPWLGVMVFYSLLHAFDADRSHSLRDCLSFIGSLFGIGG